MPNFIAVLKEEITRLSRKELRKYVDPIKKSSAAHRRQIATLKRQITKLERTVGLLSKRANRTEKAAPASEERPQRFVAKGLRSLRSRLGLSAADFATLVGVSGQSIYNWEMGKAAPRRGQLAALAALRGLGKREAQARLEQVKGAGKASRRRAAAGTADKAAAKRGTAARKAGPKKAAAKKPVARKSARPAAKKPAAKRSAPRATQRRSARADTPARSAESAGA